MLALLGYSALLLLELGTLGVIAYVVSHADERRAAAARVSRAAAASAGPGVRLTPQPSAPSRATPPTA